MKMAARIASHLVVTWRVGEEEQLQDSLGVGVHGTFPARLNFDDGPGQRDWRETVKELPRHREANLARELGTSPIVELRAIVEVEAGRIAALKVGPNDMAEILRLAEFKTSLERIGNRVIVGTLGGVFVSMLEEDIP